MALTLNVQSSVSGTLAAQAYNHCKSTSSSSLIPTAGTINLATTPTVGLLTTSTSNTASSIYTNAATTSTQWGLMNVAATRPLKAASIPSQVLTLQYYGQQTNNQYNAQAVPVVYIWRPTTQSVVSYLYESTTLIGAEFSASGGSTQTVDISLAAGTVSTGDQIYIEMWYNAAPAKSISSTNTLNLQSATLATTSSLPVLETVSISISE